MKQIRLILLLAFGFMLIGNLVAQQKLTDNASPIEPFVEVVKQNFRRWDKDADGKLSPFEVSSAAGSLEFKSEQAAAIAAIRIFYFGEDKKRQHTRSVSLAELLDSPRKLKREYQEGYMRLHSASRELFPQDLPKLEAIKQQTIGDCYLVSVVGAMVSRNADTIKSMIKPKEKGWGLEFGNGSKPSAERITDADIIICSSAGKNGLWLTILEKAYRNTVAGTKSGEQRDRYTRIDDGGREAAVIEKLDGQKSRQINLRRRAEGFGDKIREELKSAFREKRLVTVGTNENKKTPKIVGPHAYAVIGYDEKLDLVKVWNPWGNDFTPKGHDGLQNGYSTKDGTFNISMKQFLQLFDELTVETQAPKRR